ncbi:MAG: NAD(+)/NADH kinase [Anaerolineae bacterium]|nr:NAD(+)/NADH kinase [Anaerolineae bacterium]
MQNIGLLYHPRIAESLRLATELHDLLKSRGLSPWLGSAWENAEARPHVADLDLIVTFGGDGTILRAARMTALHGTPILSVNLGRFGFLAEARPDQLAEVLETVLAGNYWLEERIMLHAELERSGRVQAAYEALNDVVVGHGTISRAIRLAAYLDGEHLVDYVADGLIVATATGSTAYSLAAGGPVLHPLLRDMLLTPIAPHRALERSLVVPAESGIEIRLSADYPAVLSIDGQIDTQMENGDKVGVSVSPHTCKLIRTQPTTYFGRDLLERLKQ